MWNYKKNEFDGFITKTYYFPNEIKSDKSDRFKEFCLSYFTLKNKTIFCIFLSLIIISSSLFFIKTEVNIDNIYFSNEKSMDFSQYETSIKAIALYHSKNHLLSEKDNILKNITNIEKFNNDINLAKSHGIYGFFFYYYFEPEKELFNEPLDIIIDNKNIDINFLLIYKYENKNKLNNHQLLNNHSKFILNIKKYLNDERYINIDGKAVIGIYNPEQIYDLKKIISIWREKAKELGIEEIYVLGACNEKNIDELYIYQIFDGFVDLSSYSLNEFSKTGYINYNFYFSLLDSNLNIKNKIYMKDYYNVYRSSDVISEYPIIIDDKNIYKDYIPDKFYFLNKIIIDWTKNLFDEDNRYIFINSFDNKYLEPHEIYGYASLNVLSKAIFDLPLKDKNYNLLNLEKKCLIAVQAHVFYIDLLNEIINKTNNIPVNFDLYITTNTEEKKIVIEDYVQKYTKANKYEIIITENKGRDVLPFLTQLNKEVIKKYKYFCHIHTKKTMNDPIYGENWRHYLYNNLLGNKDIISEYLTYFENDEKLGVIFPDTYSTVIKYTIKESIRNKRNINKLLQKVFPGFQVGNKFDYPAGDMFWARTNAVYQVFELNISELCPRETGQIDGTIMHAIERIWLFIAKLNGYHYIKLLRDY